MSIHMKRLLLGFSLLLVVSAAFGQSAKLKRAQKYMEDLNYILAIEVYQQVLEQQDVAEAKINIAECYRKIGDAKNAERWLAEVVLLPEAQPMHYLYYGMALQRNEKCALARPWFQKYSEAMPDDIRGQNLARSCDAEADLKSRNAGIYQVRNLPVNSDLDDFSPTLFQDQLIFASDRDRGASIKREHSWTGSPFNDLYAVKVASVPGQPGQERYGRPDKFSKEIRTKYHDAAISFSPDGKELYYTRNNLVGNKLGKDEQGITRLKVFVARKGATQEWLDPEDLPFNSDQYSVAHPSLTPDGGRIYFSSDMPGGFGGMDLYYCDYESGRWGTPVNLGRDVNTEGNELFPTCLGDSVLYFASDGHIGLGGLDVYRIERNRESDTWGEVYNLGFPMNSYADDLGLVINPEGTFGYFSSDRPGGQGRDDIYSFVKIAAPVDVFVFDEQTGKPLQGAKVTHTCGAIAPQTTNDKGLARYEIKLQTCCTYTAQLDGYDPGEKEGCTEGLTQVPVRVEIPLRRSVQITLQGVVYDQLTGEPVPGATVSLHGIDDHPDPVITDEFGRYTFPMFRDECYKAKAEKSDYLAAFQENICTDDIKEDIILELDLFLQPITKRDLTDRAQRGNIVKDPRTGLYLDSQSGKPFSGVVDGVTYQNGRIVKDSNLFETRQSGQPGEPLAYLLHIYYDFDRANIREESLPELNKLLKMLNENPLLIVELASHTDARGSHRYNRRLSQRRAESVVDWLVARGISLDRLVPRGYGETSPVNDCVNNVPCNERKHQMNRRTEFRILGCMGCVDPEASRLSKPNEQTRVDACKNCPF